MFYIKTPFHVFNYKDKQNRNRPPLNINLVPPKKINVKDRLVSCHKCTWVFLMVNNSCMCGASFRQN